MSIRQDQQVDPLHGSNQRLNQGLHYLKTINTKTRYLLVSYFLKVTGEGMKSTRHFN